MFFRFLMASVATLALGGSAFAQGAGAYTAAQAAAGQGKYAANCAGCHRDNLAGGGDAPALAGHGFMSSWATVHRGSLQFHFDHHASGRCRWARRTGLYQHHRLSAAAEWRQGRVTPRSARSATAAIGSIATGDRRRHRSQAPKRRRYLPPAGRPRRPARPDRQGHGEELCAMSPTTCSRIRRTANG